MLFLIIKSSYYHHRSVSVVLWENLISRRRSCRNPAGVGLPPSSLQAVHKRLYSFLCRHDILYNSQYGFRPNHSTTHAITEFSTNVLNSMDQGEHCLSVFLDLSKAFDTINHNLLLRKRSHYGIRGKALGWFGSYLINRQQYVSYKGVHSKLFRLDYGVPQGLGPWTRAIYIVFQ